VDVAGIGQPQGRLLGRIVPVSAPGKPRREARDLAARQRLVARPALPLAVRAHSSSETRRPGRRKKPATAQPIRISRRTVG
jgi:hypothetical protein